MSDFKLFYYGSDSGKDEALNESYANFYKSSSAFTDSVVEAFYTYRTEMKTRDDAISDLEERLKDMQDKLERLESENRNWKAAYEFRMEEIHEYREMEKENEMRKRFMTTLNLEENFYHFKRGQEYFEQITNMVSSEESSEWVDDEDENSSEDRVQEKLSIDLEAESDNESSDDFEKGDSNKEQQIVKKDDKVYYQWFCWYKNLHTMIFDKDTRFEKAPITWQFFEKYGTGSVDDPIDVEKEAPILEKEIFVKYDPTV